MFYDAPVVADRAIDAPAAPEVKLHHMVTVRLNGRPGSGIRHVVNDFKRSQHNRRDGFLFLHQPDVSLDKGHGRIELRQLWCARTTPEESGRKGGKTSLPDFEKHVYRHPSGLLRRFTQNRHEE